MVVKGRTERNEKGCEDSEEAGGGGELKEPTP